MSQLTKEDLTEMLKNAIYDIEFTKVDGSTRKMKCTLKESYTQASPEKKTERIKKANDDVISVWDVEFNGWRSFKISNLLSCTPNQIAHY